MTLIEIQKRLNATTDTGSILATVDALADCVSTTDDLPCEDCKELVPVDDFCGDDKPHGYTEYLCGDCYCARQEAMKPKSALYLSRASDTSGGEWMYDVLHDGGHLGMGFVYMEATDRKWIFEPSQPCEYPYAVMDSFNEILPTLTKMRSAPPLSAEEIATINQSTMEQQ